MREFTEAAAIVLGIVLGIVLFIGVTGTSIAALCYDDEHTLSKTGVGLSNVRTIIHDEHIWAVLDHGALTHHPDCPCVGKE